MNLLVFLIPVALGMGLLGLAAFLWSMRSGQYDDLDGAAERILLDEDARSIPQHRPRSKLGQPTKHKTE